MSKVAFDAVALGDTKFQIEVEHFLIADEKAADVSIKEAQWLRSSHGGVAAPQPRISTWDYLSKNDVVSILETRKMSYIRKLIENKMKKRPKGFPRIIFRELMYTVAKYCKVSKFNAEQTGAVLSQFYWTHIYFVASSDTGAEKLYDYFKEMQLCHSLPFPPKSLKLFNLQEIQSIMVLFCRLYLRNLPLIRFIALPNFSLQGNYHISPDTPLGKAKKGTKEKQDKKKGPKKKSNF